MTTPIQIKFKKIIPEAVIPTKAHASDTGFDIICVGQPEFNKVEGYIQYRTGIKVQLPKGYGLQVRPRSSISKYDLMLANSLGTIDEGYTGEIFIRFKYIPNVIDRFLLGLQQVMPQTRGHWFEWAIPQNRIYKEGDRIAQLIVEQIIEAEFQEVDDLEKTERGEGGFGSTNTSKTSDISSTT